MEKVFLTHGLYGMHSEGIMPYYPNRGGARNFPTGMLTLPMRVLKYSLQGITNAKTLRKIAFHFPTGG